MAIRYIKIFSTSLAIKDMQIKITMKYHFTLLKWLLSTRHIITNVGEVVEKEESSFTIHGTINWYSHYEKQYEFSSKIKNRITIVPSNPSFGYIPEKLEIICLQRYMCPYVHCSIIHSGKDRTTTKMSFDQLLDKEDVLHTYY